MTNMTCLGTLSTAAERLHQITSLTFVDILLYVLLLRPSITAGVVAAENIQRIQLTRRIVRENKFLDGALFRFANC